MQQVTQQILEKPPFKISENILLVYQENMRKRSTENNVRIDEICLPDARLDNRVDDIIYHKFGFKMGVIG